jgi:hypothetical protein
MDKILNKPFRLPSGSGKKFAVYVKSKKTRKIVKVTFGDPTWKLKETVQRGEHLSEQGINAILSRTRQHLRIGLVRCGTKSQ